MANCGVCGDKIVSNEMACDGICGKVFHAKCFRSGTKSSLSKPSTCNECADIKPCHVLRLMKGIVERIDCVYSEQSLVANKVNNISSNWANLAIFSEDLNDLNTKVDSLLNVATQLNSNCNSLLDKSNELSLKILNVTNSVEDLHSLCVNANFHSGSVDSGPVMPLMEDIRRSIKQVRGDFGSWSSTVSGNSELISSIASDIKRLSEKVTSSPNTAVDIHPDTLPPVTQSPQLRRKKRRQRKRLHRPNVGSSAVDSVSTKESSINSAPPVADCCTPVALETAPGSVFGDPGCSTLRPAKMPKCVFISRIHPDTTERDIVEHLSSRAGISHDSIACRKISPSNRRSGCSFTSSFKVLVPDECFSAVVSPSLWPADCIVREFIPKAGPRTTAASKNSSVSSHVTTLT